MKSTARFWDQYRCLSGLVSGVVLLGFTFLICNVIAVCQTSTGPQFRLPLPGGKDWKLSTEAASQTKACGGGWGGLSNDGSYDCLHANKGMYSLDLVDNNRQDGELSGTADVDVLAAADGF